MSAEPLVSILIPVYDREILIGRALESALGQNYRNVEIVVVDNCSRDGTFEVVSAYARKDPRLRLFRNPENLGPVRNWLKCLEYSRGSYVKILFSDDWLEAAAIARLLVPMQEDPSLGFSYSSARVHFCGSITRAAEQRDEIAYRLPCEGILPTAEFLLGVLDGACFPVSPGCALFRRSDVLCWLEGALPNRLGLPCFERGVGNDLMIFLRACDDYHWCYYINDPLVHFLGHPGSLTVASKKDAVHVLCYDVAAARFLSTARNVTATQKRRLNAILFSRCFDPARMREIGMPWQVFPKMFPENYGWFQLDLPLLLSRVLRRSYHRLTNK